jgi:S1-C subfamily serine protease
MRRYAPLALVLAAAACHGALPALSDAQTVTPPPSVRTPLSDRRRTAITEAVARVAPSVVTVQVKTRQRVPVDMLEQIFGGRSGERTSASIGSGFVVRADGLLDYFAGRGPIQLLVERGGNLFSTDIVIK